MSIANEPMTSRRLTRLKFLEQESEQLRSYKSDLEFCLINTKRLLSEIISAQVISSHRRIDSSGETEFSTHITLKTLETALEKNIVYLNKCKKTKIDRDIKLGKVLISEQLAEENIRKEHEMIKEIEEHTNDLKYVLDKKDSRINHLKLKIDSIESQLSKLRGDSIVVLNLSDENLNLYKQAEKVKASLSRVSKNLQITEMQTEELVGHYENLSSTLSQYKIFLKNPMIRNKKNTNFGSTQALDMTVNHIPNDSESSSSEVCFPDKLQIETKIKPRLPKLDFTKVVKPTLQVPVQTESYMQLKTKSEYLEKKCKEKTDLLNELREKIKAQLEKNSGLAEKIKGKKSHGESPKEKAVKLRRKRAMSNTLDYLTQAPNEIIKVPVTEESEDEKKKLEESYDNISSFNGSEVAKYDYQEPDSILAEYIHEIVHE